MYITYDKVIGLTTDFLRLKMKTQAILFLQRQHQNQDTNEIIEEKPKEEVFLII